MTVRATERKPEQKSSPKRSDRGPARSAANPLHALQQRLGNRSTHALIQTRLRVGRPGDRFEREAERVARTVGSGKAGPCGCGASCGCSGAPKRIQRHPLAGRAGHGPSALELTLRGGRPLRPDVLSDMESHFGRDFGAVRIHTGGEAQSAASKLGAEAFAVGTSIAFGAGRYQPATVTGRQLLAHELTHVVQQGGAPPTHSEAGPGPPPASVGESAGGPMLAMRGTVARMPVRLPVRVPMRRLRPRQPRRMTPAQKRHWRARRDRWRKRRRGIGRLEGVPYHQRTPPPSPYDGSFHARLWRHSAAQAVRQTTRLGQIPWATLQRGGVAPHFVSYTGLFQTMASAVNPWAMFMQRQFHILDAIEYEVGRARSDQDLREIILEFLPNTWLGRAVFVDEFKKGLSPPIPMVGPRRSFRLAPTFDPQGTERLRVLARAVSKRRGKGAAPKMLRGPLARQLADMLLIERVKRKKGRCKVRTVKRLGTSARHNTYATHVTGSIYDFHIKTPEGVECTTDGLDRHKQTWEVKTGYRFYTDTGIIWSPSRRKYAEIFARMEAQRARCLYVTARCGYKYAYAFDNEEVADAMRIQWSNLPPVYHIKPPYAVPP